MMDFSHPITPLIVKFVEGTITQEEKDKLDGWRQEYPGNEQVFQTMVSQYERMNSLLVHASSKKKIFSQLKKSIPALQQRSSRVIRMNWKYVAVASVVLLAASPFFFPGKHQRPDGVQQLPFRDDQTDVMAPTGTRSVLKLGSGRVIDLDSAKPGSLADQPNAHISKLQNGDIVYNGANEKPDEIFTNTLSTARGGQTSIKLDDGTRVWLNASSALTFPARFAGSQRRVEIKGEAYFEVAPRSVPFIVHTDKADITVLGTHFDVKAYNEGEGVRTTLLEGAVRVSSGSKSALLKPGDQAHISGQGSLDKKSNTDLDEVMAWKNGELWLDGNDIRATLQEIQRWYDIEVVFEAVPEIVLVGSIKRNMPLSSALKILKNNGLHYQLVGKVLTIQK